MPPLIQSDPPTVEEVAGWLEQLADESDSIADIARALKLERADSAADEVLTWAEALRACVRSHQKDVELLKPLANWRFASGRRNSTDAVGRSAGHI